jgi:hypothetical protein
MASPIEVQLILADAAQSSGGKVHMLGAGWSITGTPTALQAVVGLIKVPWDRANEQLRLRVQLEDEDGKEVVLPGPDSTLDQRIEFEATLEVGRPPGLKHGTPIDSNFAIGIPPMPLTPGRYTWRLKIADDVFTTSFTVLAQMPTQSAE